MNTLLKMKAESRLPTRFGTFTVRVYEHKGEDVATAVMSGDVEGRENVPLRVHSACFTAESLGSLKCDCKEQLDIALQYISKYDGVVVYLQQEGRGIGLGNKIRAYALQEQGHDTIAANLMLGFPADMRTYDEAAEIINDLNLKSIQLMTNNPEKVQALKELGITISGRIPVLADVNQYSAGYLETKRAHMGHMMELDGDHLGPIRPFVHVNFAIGSNAQSATEDGQPLNLSCREDWERVHYLRESYSAIAVGGKTWNTDKPRLTAREEHLGRKPTRQPNRVIFAGRHSFSFTADERKTFVVGIDQPEIKDGRIAIDTKDYDLKEVLFELRKHQITSLLVEGGPTLIKSFLNQSYVDLLTIYVATGDAQKALKAAREALSVSFEGVETEVCGNGTLLTLEKPGKVAPQALHNYKSIAI